jgi:uncharacterized membrane protein
MPRLFSIKPTLSMKNRAFKGLRGFGGKPSHPPLTDIPVAAYIFAMVFDLIAVVAGRDSDISSDAFTAATYAIIAGLVVSIPTALTGFWDWLKSTPRGTQAWRTANWHMAVMIVVTLLVVADIVLRLDNYDARYPDTAVVVLSVVVGSLVSYGAAYGGTLVYEYGFNVETAGDSPAWHPSDRDIVHGENAEPAAEPHLR